ncbi:ABC transporter ATP-binding protein [Acetobacter sp. TBRC 12305]|uniref:ABC transporter ATP-binding protein n=1 Tax=Acetobacter garciniae TaxID=2817435 RepID=A0A939HQ93_9PROT|nr:ABC transporter ATP-binding protein [Acetobacter garciniae]MBO1325441.1 ABC transporter ATP-binding protein [Acetobacter garciniae]MBX0345387.1 ABC transporter ATP-binding protein [Acetobacter garciniae]
MNAPASDTGLMAQNLFVSHGRRMVLHGVTVGPFGPGTLNAVLGPNGSGKSTLLRAMSGLVPLRGAVTLDGQDLGRLRLPARSQRCLYLPQSLPEPMQITVIEAMMAARHVMPAPVRQQAAPSPPAALPDGRGTRVSTIGTAGSTLPGVAADPTGCAGQIARGSLPNGTSSGPEAALAWLEHMGIAHLAMRGLRELSGGQRQLVGLAQALSRRPRALLLDEPLSALDPYYQQRVMDLLAHEARETGLVVVLVLHDLNMALARCHNASVLNDGRIEASGPPETVLTPALLRRVYRIDACLDTGASGQRFLSVRGVAPAPRSMA